MSNTTWVPVGTKQLSVTVKQEGQESEDLTLLLLLAGIVGGMVLLNKKN